MKLLLSLVALLLCLTTVQADADSDAKAALALANSNAKRLLDLEKKVEDLQKQVEQPKEVKKSNTVVIPPGYHAHTKTDGTRIVHADSTGNNAAAHEGVEWPWYKTGFPGQTIEIAAAPVASQSQPQTQPKLVRGNVPGVAGEHFVPEGSPFAATVESPRLRQLSYNGPFVTGSVCLGPNCPRK